MNLFRKLCDKAQFVISRVFNFIYESYMRTRLKNRDFTILCSNCIGGMIYHRLGLPFRSPTINLWMYQRDFIKFASKIRHYQDMPLHFIETNYDYPVAMLDDITIYFNHSQSSEDACSDWNRRIKRINFDNLFLIMYDREDITKDDIKKLENIPCKGKLVLSEKTYPDIPYVKTIKPSQRMFGYQCIDQDWLGFKTFEKHFDFVKWLNQ